MKNLSTAISFIFIVQFSFGQELIPYQENGKFGYRDSIGNIVIPAKYDYAKKFSEGFAQVSIGGSYVDGRYIDGDSYKSYTYYKGGKYGLIDQTGKEITPIKYDEMGSFIGGRALVRVNEKWGFIDLTGKEVTPIIYDMREILKAE